MVDRQIKVLLIEDNPGDARLIEEMLYEVDGTPFDVENVSRLSDGLTRIQKGGIDAVLLDLGLPDSSGIDTFEKVYDQAPEVPIVMLTGLDDTELALEGMSKGAQDYLVKGRADGDLLARTLRYAIERKAAEAHIEHLNSVLKAIRNVNQLIVTETERDSLLRKSCDALVDARSYDAAWLGFLGDDETFDLFVGSGFREDIAHFSDRVAGGDHPPCIRDALSKKGYVMVIDKTDVCRDCFFKDACLGRATAVIRVEHAGRFFGLLTVSFAPDVVVDDEEKGLLVEVASDIGIALHNIEITEARKVAEDALLESEKKYRMLADNTVDCIWQTNLDFEFTYANPHVLQLVGFTQEEWVGSSLFEHCSPEDMKFCLSLVEEWFKKRFEPSDVTFEMQLFHKNGETVDVEISSTILFDDDGNPVGVQGATRNITERKVAAEMLRMAGERFKTIVETAPSVLMISNAEGSNIYVSPNCEEFTGYDPDELTGGIMQWVHEDDAKRVKDIFDRTFQKGVGCKDFEYKAVKKNGDVWYASSSWEPLIDVKGEFKGAVFQTIDTTERKAAADALKESEERYRVLFETAKDAIFLNDGTGKFMDVNSAACELLGYSKEELLKLSNMEIDADPRGYEAFLKVRNGLMNEAVFEVNQQRKDGTLVPVEISGKSFEIGDRKLFLAIARDITERKSAEDQIKRSLQEKEVLLREIHHRVKNNLQVISSLLNIQAQAAEDKDAINILAEARDRIKTMSLIHSQLYEGSDLAAINMKEFVNRLLGQLLQSYPVGDTRVAHVVYMDDYPFPISTAVPVGLIINELLSNALKHAFYGRDEGKIEISLTAPEEGRTNLTVSDDGVGLPIGFDIDKSKTLGLRLVKILAKDQLQGTLEVTSDEGATFRIEFETETDEPGGVNREQGKR